MLFVVGINSALRISDLLQLRVVHLMDDRQHITRWFWIREQKPGKRHKITINNSIRMVLEEFLEANSGIADNPNHFRSFNTKINNYAVPIKRGQAWKFITSICVEVGLRGNYSTHSLRKTWGYHPGMQGEGTILAAVLQTRKKGETAYDGRALDGASAPTRTELKAMVINLATVRHVVPHNSQVHPFSNEYGLRDMGVVLSHL